MAKKTVTVKELFTNDNYEFAKIDIDKLNQKYKFNVTQKDGGKFKVDFSIEEVEEVMAQIEKETE